MWCIWPFIEILSHFLADVSANIHLWRAFFRDNSGPLNTSAGLLPQVKGRLLWEFITPFATFLLFTEATCGKQHTIRFTLI